MKWTQEQQRVIEARGSNLLVSAAAGSGKTAVLVERILSMLTDRQHPMDIDRLLIVTFTNAAAGEMKERIRFAIEQNIEELEAQPEQDGQMLEHLHRQISLLLNAQITTIHSFCQHVIRNYFHVIGLDPALRIADEGEQKLLQNEVMEQLLEESYAQDDGAFLHMAECLAPGRDDAPLIDLALSLYHFSRSFPFPEKWLRQCAQAYASCPSDDLSWMQPLLDLTTQILQEVYDQVQEALGLAQSADGPYVYLDALQQDLAGIRRVLAAQTYAERSEAIRALSWARLSPKQDERILPEKKQRVKDLRDDYKKTTAKLAEEFFYASPRTLFAQMQKSAPVLEALTDFTCRFAERFLEEKQKRGLMDFNDLEHFALKILVQEADGEMVPTQAAQELAARYEEIMIDEYQDSNLVQETILTAVSRIREGRYNLFMVGDVKQSIYRFRLARPELFMEKYDTYSAGQGNAIRIDLHKNFRSRAQVLECVNFLFGQLMEKHLGNVDYDEAAALYPGAEFPEGDDPSFRDTEILLIDTDEYKEKQPDESARELEARAVANRIRRIVGKEKIWDKEQNAYRTAQYKDIVILLRTIQGWADVFVKVLTDLDIPAFSGTRTGYFSAVEIQTVLSLLRLIDNPCQDIPMAAVLHSPVVGLSAQELARIRSRHAGAAFYEACMQEESLQDFFRMLAEFREMAVYTPIHELLWQILERTGYGAYAAAMPGGSRRKANLDMLVEKAIAYEAGSYRGLYHFIRYMENLRKYEVDFGEAMSGGQENAVRILSIHKSKGLEFPVVFVCGMGKQMNQSDSRSPVIMHAELGIGIDCVDPQLRTRTGTLLKRFIKRRTVYENLGEELRVLYVAMTRAKEKLILTGTLEKTEEKLQKWSRVCLRRETVLPFAVRAGAATYWDWLLPALMRNRCFSPLAQEYGIAQDIAHPLYQREIFCSVYVKRTEDLLAEEKQRQSQFLITQEELLELPKEQIYEEQAAKELEERLCFCYPYRQQSSLPAKVSVSELKKMAAYDGYEDGELFYEEPQPVPLIPEFLQKKQTISGASRGTVYHKMMECLDFTLFADEQIPAGVLSEKICGERERLVSCGHLTREAADAIDPAKIAAFLNQPLAKRMARAAQRGDLLREQQFVLEVPASRIRPEFHGQEPVLIQGIIDACFLEGEQYILVDYKTDFVKPQEISSLYEKYAVQLEYYKTALERLTHRKVAEKLIYSFCRDCVLSGGGADASEGLENVGLDKKML